MVDFASMKVNKAITPPNFDLYITVRLAAKSKKGSFLAEITFFSVDFLGKKLISKSKVCIYSNSHGHTSVSSWIFFSCYFRWTSFSHFLRASIAYLNFGLSCSKGILGNWVTPRRGTPPLPISKIFDKCWTTKSHQWNIVSIALFTSQNSPKLSW